MPLGGFEKFKRYWNEMEHNSSWPVLMMITHWAKM